VANFFEGCWIADHRISGWTHTQIGWPFVDILVGRRRFFHDIRFFRPSTFLQSDLVWTWYRWSGSSMADSCRQHRHVCIHCTTHTFAILSKHFSTAEWKSLCQKSSLRPSRSTISTFYAVLRRSYCTDLHQTFTQCRCISGAIKACIHMALVHTVSECQSKEWRRSILTFAKTPPKLIACLSNVPWATVKLMSVCNSHTFDYLCWKAGEDRSNSWFSVEYADFCRFVQKGAVVTLAISGVTGQILIYLHTM